MKKSWLVALLLFGLLLLAAPHFTFAQQAPEVPTYDLPDPGTVGVPLAEEEPAPPLTIDVLGLLSTTVFGVVGLVSAWLTKQEDDPGVSSQVKTFITAYRSLILQGIAFAVGVLVAYLADANLTSLSPKLASVPPVAGYFVTGFVLSLGGEAIEKVFALLTAFAIRLRASGFSPQSAGARAGTYQRFIS